jgi:hypothetical protein
MKIYKLAQNFKEDSIVWKCPVTGMYIVAPRMDGKIIEYSLYFKDKSYFDSFATWYLANEKAKKINRNVEISRTGKLEK